MNHLGTIPQDRSWSIWAQINQLGNNKQLRCHYVTRMLKLNSNTTKQHLEQALVQGNKKYQAPRVTLMVIQTEATAFDSSV